jgi:hypothetical protein
MAEEEQKLRDKIVLEGIETCMRMTKEDDQVPPTFHLHHHLAIDACMRFWLIRARQDEECRQCSVCLYDCYLSAVTCSCKDNKQIVCLRHSKMISLSTFSSHPLSLLQVYKYIHRSARLVAELLPTTLWWLGTLYSEPMLSSW